MSTTSRYQRELSATTDDSVPNDKSETSHRVDKLRTAVDSGEYCIHTKAVAEAMMSRLLEEEDNSQYS